MALGLATALRNSRLDAIKTAIDAGSGAGKLRIYDGSRPATGGSATNLLAELVLSDPCSSGASSGTLTLSAISDDASANATGTATWGRIVDSDNNFVLDCSVGTSGTDIILNTASIVSGATVSMTSAVFTEGNA
jgi:hypothetical protein